MFDNQFLLLIHREKKNTSDTYRSCGITNRHFVFDLLNEQDCCYCYALDNRNNCNLSSRWLAHQKSTENFALCNVFKLDSVCVSHNNDNHWTFIHLKDQKLLNENDVKEVFYRYNKLFVNSVDEVCRQV